MRSLSLSKNIRTANRRSHGLHDASPTEVDGSCGSPATPMMTRCRRRYMNSEKIGQSQVAEQESVAMMRKRRRSWCGERRREVERLTATQSILLVVWIKCSVKFLLTAKWIALSVC